MIYLHKILPTLILPIMLFIIITIVGIGKNNNKVIYAVLITLYLISTPIFAINFFRLIEGSRDRIPIRNIKNADAIVVLSGMLEVSKTDNSTNIEWRDPDRFFGGLELFKEKKASILVFTGGKLPFNKTKKTEGDILKEYAITYKVIPENILVTEGVENTEAESNAVHKILPRNSKIILITSAYHMYRAKLLFEKKDFMCSPIKLILKR